LDSSEGSLKGLPCYKLNKDEPKKENEKDITDVMEKLNALDSISLDSTLKQRSKKKSKENDQDTDSKEADSHEFENKKKEDTNGSLEKSKQDPILWFGVLVPQSLRTAQSEFRSGIEKRFLFSFLISGLMFSY